MGVRHGVRSSTALASTWGTPLPGPLHRAQQPRIMLTCPQPGKVPIIFCSCGVSWPRASSRWVQSRAPRGVQLAARGDAGDQVVVGAELVHGAGVRGERTVGTLHISF